MTITSQPHGSDTGFVPAEKGVIWDGNGIEIEAYTSGNYSPKTLMNKLTGRQLRGGVRFANGVSGILPFGEMNSMALLSELNFARPVLAITNTGAVTSQGDSAVRSDVARATYGLTGSGVKVGILSDSFNTSRQSSDHYSTDVASGDLPSGVTIVQDLANSAQSPTTDEGRAMRAADLRFGAWA